MLHLISGRGSFVQLFPTVNLPLRRYEPSPFYHLTSSKRLRRGVAAVTEEAKRMIASSGRHGLNALRDLEKNTPPSGIIIYPEILTRDINVQVIRLKPTGVSIIHAEGEDVGALGLASLVVSLKIALVERINEELDSSILAERIAKLSLFSVVPEDGTLLAGIAGNQNLGTQARWVALLVHEMQREEGSRLVCLSRRTTVVNNPRTSIPIGEGEDYQFNTVVRVTGYPNNFDLPALKKDFPVVNDEKYAMSRADSFMRNLPYFLADGAFGI